MCLASRLVELRHAVIAAAFALAFLRVSPRMKLSAAHVVKWALFANPALLSCVFNWHLERPTLLAWLIDG